MSKQIVLTQVGKDQWSAKVVVDGKIVGEPTVDTFILQMCKARDYSDMCEGEIESITFDIKSSKESTQDEK